MLNEEEAPAILRELNGGEDLKQEHLLIFVDIEVDNSNDMLIRLTHASNYAFESPWCSPRTRIRANSSNIKSSSFAFLSGPLKEGGVKYFSFTEEKKDT